MRSHGQVEPVWYDQKKMNLVYHNSDFVPFLYHFSVFFQRILVQKIFNSIFYILRKMKGHFLKVILDCVPFLPSWRLYFHTYSALHVWIHPLLRCLFPAYNKIFRLQLKRPIWLKMVNFLLDFDWVWLYTEFMM